MGDFTEIEIEVDTIQIFREKQQKLRTVDGIILLFYIDVYESETPYVMIFLIKTAQNHSVRMDIQKDQLAKELRLWLEGKIIRNPAVVASPRIERLMQQFIKFGHTPKQEDLIMWILSRSELYWRSNTSIVFGGNSENIDFNDYGRDNMRNNTNDRNNTNKGNSDTNFHNDYPRTVEAANDRSRNQKSGGVFASHGFNDLFSESVRDNPSPAYTRHPVNNETGNHAGEIRSKVASQEEDLGTFELTRKLLGRSVALDQLKSSSTKIKGRSGAKQALTAGSFGSDQFSLGSDIEKAREKIKEALEVRRRSLEVSKVRQDQTADKYLKIRESIKLKQSGGNWTALAEQELVTLQKIHEDIQDDIKKQKNRTLRTSMKIGWTMAPNGNLNRKGHSLPGPSLGPGPLPPNATSRLKNPYMESTVKHYYWDTSGRRHENPSGVGGLNGGGSLVDQVILSVGCSVIFVAFYFLCGCLPLLMPYWL